MNEEASVRFLTLIPRTVLPEVVSFPSSRNVLSLFSHLHALTTWRSLLDFASLPILGEGTAVAQWLRCCATHRKVAGSIPAGASGFFIDIKSFQSHYGPGVDSASNRNEYRQYFLGGKGGRCVRLTTLPAILCRCHEICGTLTSWNPLGLSRPVMGLIYLFLSTAK